jgi:hypothetical protein
MHKLRRCDVVAGGFLVFGVLAGCVVESAGPAEHLGQTEQHFDFDEQYNGRFIVGEELEKPAYVPRNPGEYFSVGTEGTRKGKTETVAITGNAALKTTTGSSDVTGIILTGGSVQLSIASARVEGRITHYALDLVEKDKLTRVCEDAIPLAGVIFKNGDHVAVTDRITLACSDGGAHECTMFGYPPGPTEGDMWKVHEACMQMLPANYCGNDQANTRTGTRIRFVDNARVYQVAPDTELPIMTAVEWPPNMEDYYFEAAFRTGHGPALCSARARWPLLTGSCLAEIPDSPHDTAANLIQAGAMLFISSRYNQLRLDTWRSNGGTGPDWVSTVRGYYNNNNGDDVGKAPWDGYVHQGTNGMLLRIPPTVVEAGTITSVSLFEGKNRLGSVDRFVARSDDPRFLNPSYTRDEEGHVYLSASSPPNPQALRLYRHKITWDYTSTTVEITDPSYEPAIDRRTGSNIIGWIAGFPGQ